VAIWGYYLKVGVILTIPTHLLLPFEIYIYGFGHSKLYIWEDLQSNGKEIGLFFLCTGNSA